MGHSVDHIYAVVDTTFADGGIWVELFTMIREEPRGAVSMRMWVYGERIPSEIRSVEIRSDKQRFQVAVDEGKGFWVAQVRLDVLEEVARANTAKILVGERQMRLSQGHRLMIGRFARAVKSIQAAEPLGGTGTGEPGEPPDEGEPPDVRRRLGEPPDVRRRRAAPQ